MKRTLPFVVIGALLATAAVPVATLAGPRRGPDLEQRLERMTETLELTQAQQDQIRAIFEANKAEAQGLRAEIRTAQKALGEAIDAGSDNDTIAGLAIQAHELRAEGRELRKEVRQQVGAVLTPEQKEAMKAKRAERRGERGGHRGGFERGGFDGGGL